ELNEGVIKQLLKHNKGKELTLKEKRSNTITIADVKPHISILLSVRVVNPKFSSASKTFLNSPTPKIKVDEENLRVISSWKLIDRLYSALEAKQFADPKNSGKTKKFIKTDKGVDANYAGKAERSQCILYVTEGKSAMGYTS